MPLSEKGTVCENKGRDVENKPKGDNERSREDTEAEKRKNFTGKKNYQERYKDG